MRFGRLVLAALAAALLVSPVSAASKKAKVGVAKAQASQSRSPDYLNCVQYVKKTTDFGLTGDAWRWWDAAAGRFERGKSPREGAVLVFKRTDRMRYGHVAVVSNIVDKRRIEIDHANWAPRGAGKGKVSTKVSVEDISAKNDWTMVRVWYGPANDFGKPYPTYGFIAPKAQKSLPQTVLAAALIEAPELGDLFDAFGDGSIGTASRVATAETSNLDEIPKP